MKNFWKNKRVVAYIALKHHTRFITPVMDAIAQKGADVEYLVAQAERSQEITAIDSGIPYRHIFDFLTPSDHQEIHDNYMALRETFARAMVKDRVFNLQMLTVLDKTLFATAQEYVGFKNYLETHDVDLCIALHELNRWGKTFSFHAKRYNTPFLTFQEGLYTTATAYYSFTMTGHAQYSTLNLVWGKSTKEWLTEYEAPKEKIISAGNTHIIDEIGKAQKNNTRAVKRKHFNCDNQLVVLLLSSIFIKPLGELLPLLEIFKKHSHLKLFIKFHPGTLKITVEKWVASVPEEIKKQIHFIHSEEDTYALMAMSDLCLLTEGSTTGLEALAFGKPIVELDLPSPNQYDFSLAQEKAALKMTPQALEKILAEKKDISALIDTDAVNRYMTNELHDTDNAIPNVLSLMQSTIQANQSYDPAPLQSENAGTAMDWSIILPVTEDPETFLTILEAISLHSDDALFELFIIRPDHTSQLIQQILDSLEGDVTVLQTTDTSNLNTILNQASAMACGRHLIFFDSYIAPKKGWLSSLKDTIPRYNSHTIFGGKVVSRFNNIIHAGMVVDANNCPVSAYVHLDKNFQKACIERSFQMIHHFAVVEKQFFRDLGGFDPEAGRYRFMDLSLRARKKQPGGEPVIYLPKVELVAAQGYTQPDADTDSVFFYSKWHGALWESEEALYQSDGITALQLNAARMTRAMEIASRT